MVARLSARLHGPLNQAGPAAEPALLGYLQKASMSLSEGETGAPLRDDAFEAKPACRIELRLAVVDEIHLEGRLAMCESRP
jgi:hypothetical protein